MNKQQKFINLLKDNAIRGWNEYKILPSLTIAQAILETGWGDKAIGNNLFGIKADKYWTGKKRLVKTSEYVNGKKIYIDAYFRDYDSVYESLEDRYRFLNKPRYKKVMGETDYKNACTEIWKAGYATDPQYPKKLQQLIEQYKLYEIDRQAINKNENPSSWAVDAWSWVTRNGLMDGNRPKSNLSREEFAIILKRLVK